MSTHGIPRGATGVGEVQRRGRVLQREFTNSRNVVRPYVARDERARVPGIEQCAKCSAQHEVERFRDDRPDGLDRAAESLPRRDAVPRGVGGGRSRRSRARPRGARRRAARRRSWSRRSPCPRPRRCGSTRLPGGAARACVDPRRRAPADGVRGADRRGRRARAAPRRCVRPASAARAGTLARSETQ